jgi:hypothetical protein
VARNLSSLTVSQPATDPNIAETGTFTFEITPGFAGGGGVTAYDLDFQYDQGTSTWVTIPASSGGMTTADTNPIASTTSLDPTSITVTGITADVYSIRVVNVSRAITSGTQTVTVISSGKTVVLDPQPMTSKYGEITVDNGATFQPVWAGNRNTLL